MMPPLGTKSLHELINEPLTGPSTLAKYGLLERTGERTYDVVLTAQGCATYTATITVEADNEDEARKFAIEDVQCNGGWVLDDVMEYDDIEVEEVKEV